MVSNFLSWLRTEKKYSAHTIKSYENDLSKFQGYLEFQYPDTAITSAGKVEIKSWVMYLLDNNYNPSSVNRKLVALSSYFKYCIKEGEVDKNPVEMISRPKRAKRLAKFIDQSTTEKVFTPDQFSDDFKGKRTELIMELFYSTGVRVSELIGIYHKDVDRSRKELKVLGKGNKERYIPISDRLIGMIDAYSKFKDDLGFPTNPSDSLLVTDKGQKLYPVFVARLVKSVLQGYASITGSNPHILRHTFATHLLNNGSDITSIKELMGHASLVSTTVYTHNTIDRLKDVYKDTHPRR